MREFYAIIIEHPWVTTLLALYILVLVHEFRNAPWRKHGE